MCDDGAELDAGFAQPGFQHRQQSSTNGLVCQDKQNATKEEKMHEKGESDIDPRNVLLHVNALIIVDRRNAVQRIPPHP
jgi:hypothetical protein